MIHLALTSTTVLGVPFALWALLINLAVGVVLPALVALVTKQLATGWFKGLTLLFLSSATGAVTQLSTAHAGFDWRAWLLSWSETFVASVIVHYGLLKGSVTGTSGWVARRFPGGLGPVRKVAA